MDSTSLDSSLLGGVGFGGGGGGGCGMFVLSRLDPEVVRSEELGVVGGIGLGKGGG